MLPADDYNAQWRPDRDEDWNPDWGKKREHDDPDGFHEINRMFGLSVPERVQGTLEYREVQIGKRFTCIESVQMRPSSGKMYWVASWTGKGFLLTRVLCPADNREDAIKDVISSLTKFGFGE